MKRIIILTIVLFSGMAAFSQMPKLKGKLNALSGKGNGNAEAGTAESTGQPKGVTAYTAEHSDASGISGKYYTLYPVRLVVNRKPFEMSEVTLEYRPDSYSGVLHWIDDEVGKGLRYGDADMGKIADFEPMGQYGIGTRVVEKLGNYAFSISNNNEFVNSSPTQSFKDKATIMRYSGDPDIMLVSSARVFESQNCIPVTKPGDTYDVLKLDTRYSFAQQFNVLSKDPEKLRDWDSTKLINAAIQHQMKVCNDFQSAAGDVFGLPKQGKDDDALEKELFGLIQPMATSDKPIAWGDKMQFVYLNTDWKVFYEDYAKTKPLYRTLAAVAVSCGWETGECRYIAVHVKQHHNGTDFGKKELGFGGSLVPVSKEKVETFKH